MGLSAEIRSTFGRLRNSPKEADTDEVIDIPQNLPMKLSQEDPLRDDIKCDANKNHVVNGMQVEDNEDIQEALVSDAAYIVEYLFLTNPLLVIVSGSRKKVLM